MASGGTSARIQVNQADLYRLRRELRNLNKRLATNVAEAHTALTLIRQTVEELGPAGAVPERLDSSYRSEAMAIVRGIRTMAERDLAPISPRPARAEGWKG
jgi:hypothetical protein